MAWGPSRPRALAVTTDIMEMHEAGFPVQKVDGVPVVTAPGEIDVTNAAELRTALLRAAAVDCPVLVVDMARTTFCDSAGLHTLLGAHRRARAEGNELRMVVTGAAVHRILALTAADRLFRVYDSLQEALAAPRPQARPD